MAAAVPRVRLASPGLATWVEALVGSRQRERQWVAVEDFEREMARRVGVRHAVAVPAGKVGLVFGLEALALPPGTRVALSGFNARVLRFVLEALGLTPVIVPPSPRTLNLDLDEVERRARAGALDVMVVTHLEGLPVDMGRVADISARHGLPFIEDCAHSLLARVGGRAVGSFGRLGVLSFGTGKHVNTLTGGMVVTDDDELAAVVRARSRALVPARPGQLLAPFGVFLAARLATAPELFGLGLLPVIRGCARLGLDPIRWLLDDRSFDLSTRALDRVPGLGSAQATVGLRLLAGVEEDLRRRRELVARMVAALGPAGARTPEVPPDAAPAYLVLPLVVDDVPRFRRRLLAAGVDVQLTWMHCIEHDAPTRGCVACHLAAHTVYLPTYPEMTAAERDALVAALAREGGAAGGEVAR
jgi:perosamine synthetase